MVERWDLGPRAARNGQEHMTGLVVQYAQPGAAHPAQRPWQHHKVVDWLPGFSERTPFQPHVTAVESHGIHVIGSGEKQLPARLEHAREFFNAAFWIRNVLDCFA